MMKQTGLCALMVLQIYLAGYSQVQPKKALFLGNSYTAVNNLPQMVSGLAGASGDSLFYDSNTPGGYTFGYQPIAHVTNPESLQKIRNESWDFVVLQEQSQTPAIPALRDSCMIPASIILHDSIKSNDSCSHVLFYQTWGRRYGGIQCFEPAYCSTDFADFDQMQDSISLAYEMAAEPNGDWIAPVGEAWRHVLHNSQMVLHSTDNSHPNLKGSYLAACVFYSIIFSKSPVGLSYTAGLDPDTALFLQESAAAVVFTDPDQWNLWNDLPNAAFQFTTSFDTLYTHNQSENTFKWLWDLGDGFTSSEYEPVHVYASQGTYPVRLISCNHCTCDTTIQEVTISLTDIPEPIIPDKIRLYYETPGSIKMINFYGDGELLFFDMAGRIMIKAEVVSGNTVLPALPPGFYLWVLNTGALTAAQGKIVVVGRSL